MREQIALLSTDVSIELFSRAVASKVFSPLQSLTSVFGMGTGGPSAFITLTFLFSKSYSLKIEQHKFRKMFLHLKNTRQSRFYEYAMVSFESFARSP